MTKPAKVAPLYVSRRVSNANEIIAWAKEQGFKTVLPPEDLHVTVVFSRKPVSHEPPSLSYQSVKIGYGDRKVTPLGDGGAVVLMFNSTALQTRWKEFRAHGASWDYDKYTPHITLTYDIGDVDPAKVEPFKDPIILGPEVFEDLDLDWKDKVVEKIEAILKFNPYHDTQGRFTTKEGASMAEDMKKQAAWLEGLSQKFGFRGLDDMMAKAPEAVSDLASIWRQTHTVKEEALPTRLETILKFNPYHDKDGRLSP